MLSKSQHHINASAAAALFAFGNVLMTRLKVDLLITAAHLPGAQALMNWAISPSCNWWDLCFVNGGNLSVGEATVICLHVIDEFCEWPLMSSIFQSALGSGAGPSICSSCCF